MPYKFGKLRLNGRSVRLLLPRLSLVSYLFLCLPVPTPNPPTPPPTTQPTTPPTTQPTTEPTTQPTTPPTSSPGKTFL